VQFVPEKKQVLPGFGLTMGYTVTYLSFIVLIPLTALFFKSFQSGWDAFVMAATSPRVMAAYRFSFGCAFAAAILNTLFGLLTAWTLVRYEFPGRRLIDMLVDVPFALPTAVAGIALTAAYAADGPVGSVLAKFGITAVFNGVGVTIAMMFVGLPFVVRTVQPVLEDLDADLEEAAASLGAGRGRVFRWVILPHLMPALVTGFSLSFARAVGEYGSIVFIAGNLPYRTEIAPLLIIAKLEEYDYSGAAAIATVMLMLSFVVLLSINVFQSWTQRRLGME
jgi:sulfate transport system permease protein